MLSAATVAPHAEITTPRRPRGGRRGAGEAPRGTARAPRREDVGPERFSLPGGSELQTLQVAEPRRGGRRRREVRGVVLDDVLLHLVLAEDGREVDDPES